MDTTVVISTIAEPGPLFQAGAAPKRSVQASALFKILPTFLGERVPGRCCILNVLELNEGKAPRAARLPVQHHSHLVNGTVLPKLLERYIKTL